MKILLVGEFSGLFKNLKEGLVALGHDVTIASQGDGWKSITNDIDWSSNKKGIVGKFEKFFKLIKVIPQLKGYDVVQLICPVIFPVKFGINKFIINDIIKNNKKVFLSGAGASYADSVVADFLQNNFKYPQLYNESKKANNGMWSQTQEGRKYNKWLQSQVGGYIPIMYEYAQGYRDIGYSKLKPTIALPMNIDKITYRDNIVKDKLVIFHGLNREGGKGTPLIREAMERLQENYPNKVECVIDGKMPLDDYLKLLEKVNVVVDQVYSCSIGMNGVYNLAMGKIVVGGGEPEFLKEYGVKTSPLVPIQASVDDIYNQLEKLVHLSNEEILEIGKKSRLFAEEVFDYKKIAQQYVDVWNKL